MRLGAVHPRRVLAIDPTTRGFGFAVFESQTTLIDWGVKSTRTEKQAKTLTKIRELIRHYQPQVLVFEDCAGRGSRRCRRIKCLLHSLRDLALRERLTCRRLSPAQVRRIFQVFGATTKHQIALAVAQQLPELAPNLPPYRKPWMSEDYRMAIFDATALALTYYYCRPLRGGPGPRHFSS